MACVCGSITSSGTPCRRKVKNVGDHCHDHHTSNNTCAVCLSELSGACKTLPCNHEFHRRCINQWKVRGNNTCPYCRAEFTDPILQYKITITVENIRDQSTRVFTPPGIPSLIRDLITPDVDFTEIVIDVDTDESLRAILSDLGMP